ncbi:hypothetical protein E2562_010196 [Oryza meyeriana var. granulata]|uniref:ZFPL1-like B-box zinc-binding domain-containing protein n=1 Tax=Oryza meyeriana var. granulata TaxID=110450 RepID=A0A6G1EII7_9ORYZ|nr:hypothetical protein E2562_010196 [Oryza meyeriana var. granulata]
MPQGKPPPAGLRRHALRRPGSIRALVRLRHGRGGFGIWGAQRVRRWRGPGSDRVTRVYCFVHKVPVCDKCICFPEHQLCVSFTVSAVLKGNWLVAKDKPPMPVLAVIFPREGSDPTKWRSCGTTQH